MYIQKGILFIGCILIICIKLSAQSDTEFWFVAPDITAFGGDEPIELLISSVGEAANVELSFPADPTFQSIAIQLAPSEVRIMDMTSYRIQLENSRPDSILKKGLQIISTAPISVYYRIGNEFNSDEYTLKGRRALGTEFYIPGQTDFRNAQGQTIFDIVATQNNTALQITPSDNIVGHPAGIPFSIFLNKGETFSCRETGIAMSDHLGGSHILSDKPIAVTITDNAVVNGGGNADLMGDQIIPVHLLGIEYLVMKGEANVERLYITAIEDSTVVSLKSSSGSDLLLEQGETQYLELTTSSTYLTSSQPIYVWHMTGFGNEAAGAILSPIPCTGTQLVKFMRPASMGFFVYLITQTGNEGGFKLNGTDNILASEFNFIPGTQQKWMASRIKVPGTFTTSTNQIHNIQGPFYMGMLNNSGNASSYSFFSDFSKLSLGGTQTFCQGDTLLLAANDGLDNYLWNTGSTQSKIPITQPGVYWVTATADGCMLSDTVIVEANDLQVELGRDTTICEGEILIIDAEQPSAIYQWENGDSLPQRTISTAGTYWVQVAQSGCTASDTIAVDVNSVPSLSLGPDTAICEGENILLDVAVPSGFYNWQDGSTTGQYTITDTGLYWVERKIDDCIQIDSLIVNQLKLNVNLGPDSTLCFGDELNLDLDMPGISFLWENGSTESTRTFTQSGRYVLEVSNRCETKVLTRNLIFEDCSCDLFVPNVFSPNQDGINDFFLPQLNCPFDNYSIAIFTRWGNRVFESRNLLESWNGWIDGKQAAVGVYYWVIRYTETRAPEKGMQIKKGNVTLLR